jgi:ABC-type glycerol-3-phosphate transport system substrate-binding protein
MNKKGICSLALVFVGGFAALFASGAQEEKAGQPVEINYISSTILESPEGDFEQGLIDKFNEENPDIKVSVSGISTNSLNQKYLALAAGNNLPDFFMVMDSGATMIGELGVAAPLSDVFDQEFLDGFSNKYLDLFSYDGIPTGLPWFTSPRGVLYRADIFEKYGITVPTTWEEMEEVAKKLTVDGNFGMTLVGTKNGSGGSRFQAVIRNFGVDEFTKDSNGKWSTDIGSQNYIDALRAYTNLDVVDGAVPPGVIETGYPDAVTLFASGKAAMIITGSNAIGAITTQVPELQGKLGAFPLPSVKRYVAGANGVAFYINKDSKHKDAIAKFLKFIMNDENMLKLGQLTGRIAPKNMAEGNPMTKDPAIKGFLKALNSNYSVPDIDGYTEALDIHGEAYQSVFTGQKTCEEAAKIAQKRAMAICEKANVE